MLQFTDLQSKKEKICVVGLGYVGLPLSVLLAKHFDVAGLDVDTKKIEELKKGIDRTGEVDAANLAASTMTFNSDPAVIAQSKFIIVAVPTPVDENTVPDLSIVERATEMVGKYMVNDSVVVYESTVYPGVTQDVCVPILEKESNLVAGSDFKVGYSPERVNPGDKEHTIDKVVKVVSGMDDESADVIEKVYGTIAPTFRAASIRAAEAAKVIENTQRDVNIALVNELAVIFNKMGISVYDVLEAAGTKWNFLHFQPGLVGGHCIGVDPYYLTHAATQFYGYRPDVILSGRKINDDMHNIVARSIHTLCAQRGVESPTLVMLGVTFKENIPDVRNSKVAGLYKALTEKHGCTVLVYDPHADKAEVKHEYGIDLIDSLDDVTVDGCIVAVKHTEFAQMNAEALLQLLQKSGPRLLFDVKHIYNKDDIEQAGLTYWSL
ncbi:MAG: nucleotide sugar dehydrogenase [Candidatus Magasanikbacteria bacterium CG10_big_fil_rev_8_21_14_0_10_47_10]|uniref:Nucleotide sugar dehydrogenase n=1 Tax=Candidatus Magasanikbacteria bacterium CG10_big_fil_rev_8_21_14_0_10_47_10 TaxID=1974652 RepID=A0A2H0TPU5_9BACT|nr:MAG: nucleotide sugar dehydrogenase [Candidatus Magasanikbacteria bacterium CG10_big_fil_rev_8_21_14_0_10_47_10]